MYNSCVPDLTNTQALFNRWTSKRIAIFCGLIVIGIGCYQLSLPNVLTGVLSWNLGYDDGVYLGASVRFVNGVLPYRDFVLVQPPGILYLLSPVALLGRIMGTHDALVFARCLTVFVTGCNAILAGLLMRPHGPCRVAVLVAGLSCALWPLTVSVDRTLELEPYLVFFCLLGALLAFSSPAPTTRRLIVAGLAFGFAGSVKIWAIFPVLAALACMIPLWRRFFSLLTGIAVSAIAACLPFFVAAPSAFIHEVVLDQLNRAVPFYAVATPFGQRLLLMSGLSGIKGLNATAAFAEAAFGVVTVLTIIAVARHWKEMSRLEWFAISACVVTIAGMSGSSVLYDHYSYFPAAFLALVWAVDVSRLAADLRAAREHRSLRPGHRSLIGVRLLATFVFLGLVGVIVAQESSYTANYLRGASNPASIIDMAIPQGACVISDFPADLLVANRFTPQQSGCPAIVDPYGMNLLYDSGVPPHPAAPPPFSDTFETVWSQDLEAANYVDLRIPYSDFFEWSSSSFTWFAHNYLLVAVAKFTFPDLIVGAEKTSYIYKHVQQ